MTVHSTCDAPRLEPHRPPEDVRAGPRAHEAAGGTSTDEASFAEATFDEAGFDEAGFEEAGFGEESFDEAVGWQALSLAELRRPLTPAELALARTLPVEHALDRLFPGMSDAARHEALSALG